MPRALPIYVEDEGGRHPRGTERYEAVVAAQGAPSPAEQALARIEILTALNAELVVKAERAAEGAESIKREVIERLEAVKEGSRTSADATNTRPTTAEAARES